MRRRIGGEEICDRTTRRRGIAGKEEGNGEE
jgi:hypothetical protein